MFTENKHSKSRPPKVFFMVILGVGILLLVGYIVMLLWNAIIPRVINASVITYWQAMGLLILSRILFGRWGSPPKPRQFQHHKRKHWKDKWKNMSEEERMAFKEKWKAKCKKNSDD